MTGRVTALAPASTCGPLTVHEGDGFLRATLSRPERRNALDGPLLTLLHAALDRAEALADCRVLILDASGEAFCGGMDLGTAVGPDSAAPYWRLLERLATTDLVTVSLVDGEATGGGVGLAAACDLVLTGRDARFRLTEVLLGLVPAMALPFVARRTGQHRAFTAALLAEPLDGPAALAAGLADRHGVVAEELLRPLLVSLRRVDRATTGALKRHRALVHPFPAGTGTAAADLLAERLADPAAVERLRRVAMTAAATGAAQ
ncbi:enoyl-CoA hydratase/isomerase family protein [Streptomyces bohaiensis]|uniref:Enoyl-CoA hydratase/isomerase family protein n=1 Tax=Streptomyces bohaiensis TaxID=1431344 RepID=A0ABX1C868_9ACTN|nr:enoyl-CoA hydratase/isomerase family protein [Streptomyces bohaiensis]NJQ14426.1 enoyl-CoA hydratase/isomerase family protein [Streptomyces bohaiensis]